MRDATRGWMDSLSWASAHAHTHVRAQRQRHTERNRQANKETVGKELHGTGLRFRDLLSVTAFRRTHLRIRENRNIRGTEECWVQSKMESGTGGADPERRHRKVRTTAPRSSREKVRAHWAVQKLVIKRSGFYVCQIHCVCFLPNDCF